MGCVFGQENVLCFTNVFKDRRLMDNFKNVCLKVKKQKNIPPLVTVIQVSYIMLTEGQEYNFHGMKRNVLKNNMHWGVSQEKENICNMFLKIS